MAEQDPLEGARRQLRQLRDSRDWDEATPVVHVNVQPPPAPPAPPPQRTPPPPPAPWWRDVLQLAGRMPAWGIVVVFLAFIVAWVVLALHGKAPVP